MSGAAPEHGRRTPAVTSLTAGVALFALLVTGGSPAAPSSLPSTAWGVTVTGTPPRDVAWKTVSRLPKSGFNVVVVDRPVLSAPGFVAFRRQARKLGFTLVAARRADAACAACFAAVNSAAAGSKLARTGATVLVRLKDPARATQLRGLEKGRAIAVVELRGGTAFNAAAWRSTIAAARADARLDLVVAPVGAEGRGRPLRVHEASTRTSSRVRAATPRSEPDCARHAVARRRRRTTTPIPCTWRKHRLVAADDPRDALDHRSVDHGHLGRVVALDRQHRGRVVSPLQGRRKRGDDEQRDLYVRGADVRNFLHVGR